MLEDKAVLITGAKGGLGTFVTRAFLDAGALVAGVSRSIREQDFAHPRFMPIAAELSNSAAAQALVKTAVDKLGGIDVLVHLLGGFAGGSAVAETDDATLDRMLDLNVKPAFHLMRAAIPHMRARGSGRILAIGSRAAVEPGANIGAYAASKAALVSLVRTVAVENGDAGISANAILPDTMDTPANRAADPQADFSKWVQPSQVAAILVHLSSDAASQVTGAVIPVYGRNI